MFTSHRLLWMQKAIHCYRLPLCFKFFLTFLTHLYVAMCAAYRWAELSTMYCIQSALPIRYKTLLKLLPTLANQLSPPLIGPHQRTASAESWAIVGVGVLAGGALRLLAPSTALSLLARQMLGNRYAMPCWIIAQSDRLVHCISLEPLVWSSP